MASKHLYGKSRLFISLCLALIVVVLFSPVNAEVEIGFTGQSGWSDNRYLDDPNGWGIYLRKSLSPESALSLSVSRFGKEVRYMGVMQFGFPPFNAEKNRELIYSDATADFLEMQFHLRLVQGSKMRLEAGAGLGVARIDLRLRGGVTGSTISVSSEPIVLGLSMNLLVGQFFRSPFALRLGYQYRAMSEGSFTTDSFEPFRDVKISSVNASLLVRLWK